MITNEIRHSCFDSGDAVMLVSLLIGLVNILKLEYLTVKDSKFILFMLYIIAELTHSSSLRRLFIASAAYRIYS